MDGLRRELRTQVEEEIRSNLRKRTWRNFLLRGLGCCGLYALSLLGAVAILGYGVARTGFFIIPFVSERVVHARAPSRLVVASTSNPEQLLAANIRDAFRAGSATNGAVLTFSEAELTSLFRMLLTTSGRLPPVAQTTAQVVVDAGVVELFTHIPAYGGGTTTVILRGVPVIRDGRITADLSEVVVGNLGIPRLLTQIIAQSLLGQLPPATIPGIGPQPAFTVSRIDLATGAVHMTLRH